MEGQVNAYISTPSKVIKPKGKNISIFRDEAGGYFAKLPNGVVEPIGGGGGITDVQISTITGYVSFTKGNDATAVVGSLVYLFQTIQGALNAGANFVTLVESFHQELNPIVLNASTLILDAQLCTFLDLNRIESSPATTGSFVLYGGWTVSVPNGISFPTEGNLLIDCNTIFIANNAGPALGISGLTTSNIIINAVEQIFIQGSEEGILHNSVTGTNNNFKLSCPDGDIAVYSGNNKKAIMLNQSNSPYISARSITFASSNATAAVHLLNCNTASSDWMSGFISGNIRSGTNAGPLLLIENFQGSFNITGRLGQFQSTPSYALSLINTTSVAEFTIRDCDLYQSEALNKVLNIQFQNQSECRIINSSIDGHTEDEVVRVDLSAAGATPVPLVFEGCTIQNRSTGEGIFIKHYVAQNARVQIQDTKIITDAASDAITSDAAGQEVRILSLYRTGAINANITNLIAAGIDIQDTDIISGL